MKKRLPSIINMCPYEVGFYIEENPFFLVEFTGVTWVHKTMQVSSAQLNKTSSAHCTVCPSPPASPIQSPLSPALPTSSYYPPLFSSGYHTVAWNSSAKVTFDLKIFSPVLLVGRKKMIIYFIYDNSVTFTNKSS